MRPALALVALWAGALVAGPLADTTVNDLFVYRGYGEALRGGALPYGDFAFEYPPLAALPIGLAALPGGGETGYAIAFALLMLACALAGQALAARLAGDGRDGELVAWLLAAATLAVGASLRTHFDLFPVALTLGALLAFARERPDLGFALLAAGALAKALPAALVPVAAAWLVGRGQGRVALRGVAVFAAVALAGSLPFAGQGYLDAARFHLERPVQIESAPATVLFALGDSFVTGDPVRPDRFKSNGLDGGPADLVALLFALELAAALVLLTLLASRRPDARHLVLCAFAVLLALIALGKVLSPQFVIWLVPFAALAWAWGHRAVALLAAAAIVLTQAWFPRRYFDLVAGDELLIVLVAVRNALLVAALIALAAAVARSPRPAAAAMRSG